MSSKELVSEFRAAPWKNEGDVERFATAAGALDATSAERLLELLNGRQGTAEQRRLRLWAFGRLGANSPDKALFQPYLRALRSGDGELRSVIRGLIPKVTSVADQPALVALLRSPDADLRAQVASILGQIGGRTVFELLGEAVRDPHFPGRREAMAVAMELAPQHALPLMSAVLATGTEEEKLEAVGYLADPRRDARARAASVPVLGEAIHDERQKVAVAAIAALASICSEDDYLDYVGQFLESTNLTLVKAAVDGLRHFSSPRVVTALRARLRAGPNVIRFASLDGLEAVGTRDVLDPLVEALGSGQIAVRIRAAEVLFHLGTQGKVDLARTVIWLLRNRDTNVRRMAVELVQTVKDPQGQLWPKLLGYLRDEDWWVRERVMDALVEMAGEAILPDVVSFLEDESDLVRRFGVDALLRLKAPASLGVLVRTASGDPDWWVRERAIETIGAIRDSRAVPHLVDLMHKNLQLRVACLAALAQVGGTSAAPEAAAMLQTEDQDVQLAALRCLKVIGGPAQLPPVGPFERDSRPEMRALARELVARWGGAVEGRPSEGVEDGASALDELLIAVARADGDDLILNAGRRPLMKRLLALEPLSQDVMTPEALRGLMRPLLSLSQLELLGAGGEVDVSYRVESEGLRFRVNVFRQLGGVGAVFRIIKGERPELDTLGLPPVVKRLADLQNGLVLVGGPTGSGKSTTLAALVDLVNSSSARHIVTLEDPIEVVHPRRKGLVNQREIGTHTGSFQVALRSTLRQDPDVILVGELRDLPTIAFAVSAAETGHLVFGTIHTVSAAGTIDRLVNVFPAGQHDEVRGLLAGSLRAVVCQYLIPRVDNRGRCLAVEVLLNNDAVANLIRKGKTFQIPSVIATSRDQGMQLMDSELQRLAKEGQITAGEAFARAVNKKEFEALLDAPPPAPPPGDGHS
jgi:twitching motility protein PilT